MLDGGGGERGEGYGSLWRILQVYFHLWEREIIEFLSGVPCRWCSTEMVVREIVQFSWGLDHYCETHHLTTSVCFQWGWSERRRGRITYSSEGRW